MKNNVILKRYDSLGLEAKASLWFTVCNFFQKGFQFFSVIVFTKFLSPSEFGEYTLYLSWFTIYSLCASLGLYNDTFNVGYVKTKNRYDYFISLVLLSCVITGIVSIILLLFKGHIPYIDERSLTILMLMIVQIFSFVIIQLWVSQQRFEYKYKSLVFITFGQAIITLVFACVLFGVLEQTAISLIIATALGYLSAVVLVVYDILRHNTIKIDFSYWKFAFPFALPLLPYYFSYMAMAHADRVLIGEMVGLKEAAFFAVAYQLSQVCALIRISVHGAYVPWLYKKLKSESYDVIRFITNRLAIILLVGLIIMTLLSPDLLVVFSTYEYYDVRDIMPPLVMCTFLMYITSVLTSIELFYEKNKPVMYMTVICSVLNVVSDFYLLEYFTYKIVAHKSFCCYVLLAAFHCIYCKFYLKSVNILNVFDMAFIVRLALLGSIFMIFALFIYEYFYIRWLVVIIGSTCLLRSYDKIKKFVLEIKS